MSILISSSLILLLFINCVPSKNRSVINLVEPKNSSGINIVTSSSSSIDNPIVKTSLLGHNLAHVEVCNTASGECFSEIISERSEHEIFGLPAGNYIINAELCDYQQEVKCRPAQTRDHSQSLNFPGILKQSDKKFDARLFNVSKELTQALEGLNQVNEQCRDRISDTKVDNLLSNYSDFKRKNPIQIYLDLRSKIIKGTYANYSATDASLELGGLGTFAKGVSRDFSPITPYKVTLYNYIDQQPSAGGRYAREVPALILGTKKVKGHSAVGVWDKNGQQMRYTSWPEKDNFAIEQAAAKAGAGRVEEYSFYISKSRYVEYSKWLKEQNFWYNGDNLLQETWKQMKEKINIIVLTLHPGAKLEDLVFKKTKKSLLRKITSEKTDSYTPKDIQKLVDRVEDLDDAAKSQISGLLNEYQVLSTRFKKLSKPLSNEEIKGLKSNWNSALVRLANYLDLDELPKNLKTKKKVGSIRDEIIDDIEGWVLVNGRYNESGKYPQIWANSPNGLRLKKLKESKNVLLDQASNLIPGIDRQTLVNLRFEDFSNENQVIIDAARAISTKKSPNGIRPDEYIKRYEREFNRWSSEYREAVKAINVLEDTKTKFNSTYAEYRRLDVRLYESLSTYGKDFGTFGFKGMSCADVATACVRVASGDPNFYPRGLIPRDPDTALKKLWKKFQGGSIEKSPLPRILAVSAVAVAAYFAYLHLSDATGFLPDNSLLLQESGNDCSTNYYESAVRLNEIVEQIASIAAERALIHMAYLDQVAN